MAGEQTDKVARVIAAIVVALGQMSLLVPIIIALPLVLHFAEADGFELSMDFVRALLMSGALWAGWSWMRQYADGVLGNDRTKPGKGD